MGRKCCDDDFGLLGDGRCMDCPYLTQCINNQKETIKELFEEKEIIEEKESSNNEFIGRRIIDNGDDL